MSYPKVIFIDTCIFDAICYNFSAATVKAFCEAVKGKKLQLLLPDPTEREISRHINERVDMAIKTIKRAQKDAPFLIKIKNWPLIKEKNTFSLSYSMRVSTHNELKKFHSLFRVKKLGYGTINMAEIMDWYDRKTPPFAEGAKRKEFPDALAIALVRDYSNDANKVVAVISQDNDMEKACGLYSNLFCYKSLSSFTEILQSSKNMVLQIRQLLKKDKSKLDAAITEHFPSLSFYIEANYEGDAQDVEVEDVEFIDLSIVGIGDREVSIVFIANVSFTAYVSYENLETAAYDSEDKVLIPYEMIEGTTHDMAHVSGIMKCKLTKDKSDFESIAMLEFDKDIVEITREPNMDY